MRLRSSLSKSRDPWKVSRAESGTLRLGTTEAPFSIANLPAGEDVVLRIFIDKYLVEVFANDHVRTAVNRAYYACFYAVSALLFDSRQKRDYVDLVTFDRKEVNAWVHEAGRFVEQLARSVEGLSH